MKKSSKKIQLKKRSISTLNAYDVKGGFPTTTIGTTSLLTVKSIVQDGENICLADKR